MPAAMKAMKATKAKKVNTAMKTKGQKTMTKGGLTTSLADATEPARKAGKKMMFGQEVMVKAQPAKTVVKAFPVSALKSNF
eukprot:Skav200242  [mRNA]  locus=scaffold3488:27938:28180:+ [translate_table: standard]